MDKYYVNYTKKDAIQPVAVLSNTNDYVYLHKLKDGEKIEKKSEKYDFNYKEYEKTIKQCQIKPRNIPSLLRKLENLYFDGENFEEDNDIFDNLKYEIEQNEIKKFKADTKLIPVLKPNWFDCVLINGASGAGKTKFLVKMVNTYLKSLPRKEKTEIVLISKKEKDAMIDKGIKGLNKIDPYTFIDDPLKVEELPDKAIVILDDFEGYQSEPKLWKLIIGFMNDVMTMGRTKLLKIFVITHQPTFGKQSTVSFVEATYYVFYPTRTAFSSLEYILEKKLGMNRHQINLIKDMKRIVISKHPKYYIYSKFLNFF